MTRYCTFAERVIGIHRMVPLQDTTDGSGLGGEFLAFDHATLRLPDALAFRDTIWTWRAGEQWAMLGPDGSGTSLLVDAILGRVPIVKGELRGSLLASDSAEPISEPVIAHVSPQVQRELALRESSFYQLRWHSGLEQGPKTVGEFLSQESVEEQNPFEIGGHRGNRRTFLRLRRTLLDWLGLKALWHRRLVHLSNGEMRKTLLVHALLKSPHLLILEDAYTGLDAGTRRHLGRVVSRLMNDGWPVLVVTHRPEEIPAAATHVVLVDGHQVFAQGEKREMLHLWRNRFPDIQGNAGELPAPNFCRHSLRRLLPGQPVVELRHVNVSGAKRRILRDITWTLREGECWALLGPNGAGKTTLLNLIQGDHPQAYSQDIRLFGARTDSTQALWRARQHIGWMSPELHQHYPAGWDAEDVICSGLFTLMGLHESCSRRQRSRARRWLSDLELGQHAGTPFGELTFGQQRLVLFARAAVKQPRMLILDEPCQGLDAEQRRRLIQAVDRVVLETGAALLFVTHHKDELPHSVSHTLRLADGRIREAGPARRGQRKR